MDKECRHCLYFDRCGSNKVCEYHEPLGDEYDDNIEDIIEDRRTTFREEWFRYIEENEEWFYFSQLC